MSSPSSKKDGDSTNSNKGEDEASEKQQQQQRLYQVEADIATKQQAGVTSDINQLECAVLAKQRAIGFSNDHYSSAGDSSRIMLSRLESDTLAKQQLSAVENDVQFYEQRQPPLPLLSVVNNREQNNATAGLKALDDRYNDDDDGDNTEHYRESYLNSIQNKREDGVDAFGLDVIFFGCGERNNQRRKTNNPSYRTLLNANWRSYKDCKNKREFVQSRIVKPILNQGGRFLNDIGGLMSDDEIFEKVSQALRDMKKQNVKGKETRPILGGDDHFVLSNQREVVQGLTMQLGNLMEEIGTMKLCYQSKLEEILAECISAQQELSFHKGMCEEKNELIASQHQEIIALKEELSLLENRNMQLEDENFTLKAILK